VSGWASVGDSEGGRHAGQKPRSARSRRVACVCSRGSDFRHLDAVDGGSEIYGRSWLPRSSNGFRMRTSVQQSVARESRAQRAFGGVKRWEREGQALLAFVAAAPNTAHRRSALRRCISTGCATSIVSARRVAINGQIKTNGHFNKPTRSYAQRSRVRSVTLRAAYRRPHPGRA